MASDGGGTRQKTAVHANGPASLGYATIALDQLAIDFAGTGWRDIEPRRCEELQASFLRGDWKMNALAYTLLSRPLIEMDASL